jgi:hypothetical protein
MSKSTPVRIAEDIHTVLRVKAAHAKRPMADLVDEILRPALREDAEKLNCPLKQNEPEEVAG